ncbi:MAG: hypothetical protein HXY39_00290 [Chloroflexi bacterium]|nr:hypothetical protein [Chloroflexota bacterium]
MAQDNHSHVSSWLKPANDITIIGMAELIQGSASVLFPAFDRVTQHDCWERVRHAREEAEAAVHCGMGAAV